MENSERKKAVELLKEMRSENKTEDDKSDTQENRLNWMYKSPADLVDREEYLLGKAIDKNFDILNAVGSSDIGRTGEQSNVPKRLLERTDSIEQVDVAKKILEDPLYAIKQKEMEARKKLLNNPVKLKQIKQMLLERIKHNSSQRSKKKKLKKKSEQDINFLILKKLEKFTDKEKRKALSKVIKSGFEFSSGESSSCSSKNKKSKLNRKRSYSSSDEYDSSSENSSNSEKNKQIHKTKSKKKSEIYKITKSKKNKESSFNSSSSDYERNKKFNDKSNKKQSRKLSNDSDRRSFVNNEKVRKSQDKSQRNIKNSNLKIERRDLKEENTIDRISERMGKGRWKKNEGKRNSSSDDEESRLKKKYGLMMPDSSKPLKKVRNISVQKYEKNVEPKAKYTPPSKIKPLSDKEREEKLREMMENAKLRKEDQEKNLAKYRKKQTVEENSKNYDDDFMRRQMSHLTSKGTMADRIKSNINNIQRSKSSMDINFLRK